MKKKTVSGIIATLILSTSLIALSHKSAVAPAEPMWIPAIGSGVEMYIENKTTILGEDLSIDMVATQGGFFPDTQVFDVYLYDYNYSLFSYWSQDKYFFQVLTSVPPGYTEPLSWNLFHFDGAQHIPPPPGDYYLIGVLAHYGYLTTGIPLKIDDETITPVVESIPTTEVFYDDGCQFFEKGIYLIATETNPVEMRSDYTNLNDFSEMLWEHVTTAATTEDFITILVSAGIYGCTNWEIQMEWIFKYGYSFVLDANVIFIGEGCYPYVSNPIALLPVGSLPAGEYLMALYLEEYIDVYTGTAELAVTILGDVNSDGKVDDLDLFDLSEAYGSDSFKLNWNPQCDSNGDGKVDVSDLYDLSRNYGKTV